MPNIDHFLPFSLREVPLARAILNGKNADAKEMSCWSSLLRLDSQSVMTHPTIGGESTSLSNSVVHLVDDRSAKELPETGAVSFCESLPASHRWALFSSSTSSLTDSLVWKYKPRSVIVRISISKVSPSARSHRKRWTAWKRWPVRSSECLRPRGFCWTMLSFRDACVVPGGEGTNEHLYGGNGDFHGRKSSLLSSASDYARSVHNEQHSSMVNRANSPNSDKTVSFFDERSQMKSK